MSVDEEKELAQLAWMELQRRKCATKMKHFNETSAREAARAFTRKPHHKMKPYQCYVCGWWHLCKRHRTIEDQRRAA